MAGMQARSLIIRLSEEDRPRLDAAAKRAGKRPRELAEWLVHWALEQVDHLPQPTADAKA
jgi:hypothetical protein